MAEQFGIRLSVKTTDLRASINEAIDWYNREYTPSMSDCYYIKIICVRNDAGCMIKNESLFIATVIESEAIER